MVLPTASGPRSPIPPPLTTQVYYEDLVRCLPAQVDRLASFLGLLLTPAKRAAVLRGVSFDTMKSGGGMASMLLRKGGALATGNTKTLDPGRGPNPNPSPDPGHNPHPHPHPHPHTHTSPSPSPSP